MGVGVGASNVGTEIRAIVLRNLAGLIRSTDTDNPFGVSFWMTNHIR